MSNEPFEILNEIKYPLEFIERTEEEARRDLLEGEEFMFLEIQVIGLIENEYGTDSLTIDFLAAFNQKAIASRWMENKVRSLVDICQGTVMGVTSRVLHQLFQQVLADERRECCLYRLSVWLSMADDGSPRWSIRDTIDPIFRQEDRLVAIRAADARRLAGRVMEGGDRG